VTTKAGSRLAVGRNEEVNPMEADVPDDSATNFAWGAAKDAFDLAVDFGGEVAEHTILKPLSTAKDMVEIVPKVGKLGADVISGTREEVNQDVGEVFATGVSGGAPIWDAFTATLRASGTDPNAPSWGEGGEQGVADAIAYNLGGGTNPNSRASEPLPPLDTSTPAHTRDDEIPPPEPYDGQVQEVEETVITSEEALTNGWTSSESSPTIDEPAIELDQGSYDGGMSIAPAYEEPPIAEYTEPAMSSEPSVEDW
jgi:hypothetical protein